MGRNVLRGRGFQLFDLSINKNWKFKEILTAQFRAEAFNILNHPQFVTGSVIGNGSYIGLQTPASFGQATSSPNTGNSVIGSGGATCHPVGPEAYVLAQGITFEVFLAGVTTIFFSCGISTPRPGMLRDFFALLGAGILVATGFVMVVIRRPTTT